MTLFWILAATLTAAVVATLVRPLLRPAAAPASRAGWDLEVYRDQLTEVERDLARGVIAAAQAEAARTEIGRRILAAAAPEAGGEAPAPAPARPSVIAALVLVAVLPLTALTLYLAIGRPTLPGRPFSAEAEAAKPEVVPEKVVEAVARLAERMKAQPGDLQGWLLLAQSYRKMGRMPEAVEAWRKAAVLAPDDLQIASDLAQGLIEINQGMVPEQARQLFETVLGKIPDDPRASHYLALARLQAGDERGALERWARLVAVSPADAGWLPLVRQQIAEVAERLHLDPAAITPQPLPPTTDGGPEARAKALAEMTGRLLARVKADPADTDGWLSLTTVYQALDNAPARLDAARHARDLAPHRADVLVAYAEAVIAATPAAGPNDRLPAEAATALRQALAVAPETPAALWYLGIDAALAGNAAEAKPLLERLLPLLNPEGEEYKEVKARIDGLKK